MRRKHRAMVNVSTSHVGDLSAKPTHVFGWSVQNNLVKTVRAVELLLGIPVEGYAALPPMPPGTDMCTRLVIAYKNNSSGLFRPKSAVFRAVEEACFIFPGIIQQLGWVPDYDSCHGCTALTTRPVFPPLAALKL